MTVTSTSATKKKARSRDKSAPKTDKQRMRTKAYSVAKKQRLDAAITATIQKIDELIGGLADEFDIGFAQASNYVHLGGRVFKDRRRPSIQNAYRFCWARVVDERWKESDGGKKAEAVHIINKSKDNADEYRSLSDAERNVLINLLQEDRDKRDTGIVGKADLRLHDIRATIDKVDHELTNLYIRSGLEFFLIGCRNEVTNYPTPVFLSSDEGSNFITHYLKTEGIKLAKYFDAFATSRAGMGGIVRCVASEEHHGDTKTATKSIIMAMFKKMYREVTQRDAFRLEWAAWSKGLPDRHNVIILGWPLRTPPTALSNIHTADEMKKVLDAVINNQCYFEMASINSEERNEGNVSAYQRGGVLISMDNTEDQTQTTGKKRKRHGAHGDDISNEENISPGEQPPQRTCRRPSLADCQADGPADLSGDWPNSTFFSGQGFPSSDLPSPAPGEYLSSGVEDCLSLPPRRNAAMSPGPEELRTGGQSSDLSLLSHGESLLSSPAQYSSSDLSHNLNLSPRLNVHGPEEPSHGQSANGLTLPSINALQLDGNSIPDTGETRWNFPPFSSTQIPLSSTLTGVFRASQGIS